VTAVDAAEALADLTEISTQIRFAVLVDAHGDVAASSVDDPAQTEAVARSARELLAAAQEAMGSGEARERLVQLQAAMPDGCVFLVQDEERLAVAITVPEPTAGLVFYDLKTCLRQVVGESLAPKPKARSGAKKAAGDGAK
jgi:predicted regulator of Ras-like GTPase activity (Roadblock/LC7/MglB family)